MIQSENINHITLSVSGFCNAKCPHCPRYTDDGFLHEYVPETNLHPDIKFGLDKSKLINLQQVYFSGANGDPFMNPHIEELVEFFSFVPSILIDTNGGIRNTEFWKNFAKYKNVTIRWSIDGLEDTNHLYRIEVDFNKVIHNAQSFISAGGEAVWKCIVFKHNEHQLGQISQIANELGFFGVEFLPADEYRFEGLQIWPVYVKGEFYHNISPTSLTRNYLNSLTTYKHVNIIGNNITENCPWLQRSQIYINLLGEVVPCCMAEHETTNNYPGRDEYLNLIGGEAKNISLYHNHLDDILKNRYSKKFNDSLNSVETMVSVCKKSCAQILSKNFENFKFVEHREPTKKST